MQNLCADNCLQEYRTAKDVHALSVNGDRFQLDLFSAFIMFIVQLTSIAFFKCQDIITRAST